MTEKNSLNVVYVGVGQFPIGDATTKRRRYMVDYMNSHNISAHILGTTVKKKKMFNQLVGKYGEADYYSLFQFSSKKQFCRYYTNGLRKLKEWYKPDSQNVIIFISKLFIFEWPFYRYAKHLGYKIVFDQVETNMLLNGNMRFLRKIKIIINEWISDRAFRSSDSFVISSFLWEQNKKKYPNMRLCLLPNSTPLLCTNSRKKINNPIKILYSGTYSTKDGVGYLIDGVIKAMERGCKCELYLLGKGQPRDMKVLERAKNKDNIYYLGYVSDEELINITQKCDILCMTRINSKFANYGFPFKLSEYLATGNILLATDIGDVTKYVQNKVSAYVVKPEDSNEIANAICHIEKNPVEAIKVANNGLNVMQKYFSIENVGKTFEMFLRSL